MLIKPLAADSLGTRSMCTLVDTGDLTIVIDPGAALGPWRYGLRPHPKEVKKLEEHKAEIVNLTSKADLIIVTHYHYDHIPRPYEGVSWLRGKTVMMKDPENNINFSQRSRARIFLEQLRKVDCKISVVDGGEVKIGNTLIKFSEAVQHGNSPKLGYVVEVCIRTGDECLVHTSDVEGLVDERQLKFIIQNKPDIIICDGPMTYMLGSRFTEEDLEKSINNLIKVVASCHPAFLVLDHHLLRDLSWKDRINELITYAESFGTRVCNAAEFSGLTYEPLEAMRKVLYESFPVDVGENVKTSEYDDV
ncbi:MAG: MBL fold metallo-hydrolase [Thaumarchaeota archaeon]|jgi:predicted metallo-beta-lactamase superfamily hydrolase|nr:MBL fold metallo-hydrolase [Candidatus Terraquivivens yellowstonensis]MCL7387378.1 MBL fold metallo-hydrolase [Candidatus Terraquivivens yellowstonensis]MCL7392036.1 MBL fold metallo-hydrolase [Candidatus Terraquivivens yellowstonensis]MCL7394998.1 MBL fold metallo-hydrolase [Candidatus Terraquivivens yellowstonensis]MCL7397792.1 MBL fold metallo-hydrolase [Candidatus Terraquivivens yellowstonensis]